MQSKPSKIYKGVQEEDEIFAFFFLKEKQTLQKDGFC